MGKVKNQGLGPGDKKNTANLLKFTTRDLSMVWKFLAPGIENCFPLQRTEVENHHT
jgi:hypothetical protein